jgi:hypothetical protein
LRSEGEEWKSVRIMMNVETLTEKNWGRKEWMKSDDEVGEL